VGPKTHIRVFAARDLCFFYFLPVCVWLQQHPADYDVIARPHVAVPQGAQAEPLPLPPTPVLDFTAPVGRTDSGDLEGGLPGSTVANRAFSSTSASSVRAMSDV